MSQTKSVPEVFNPKREPFTITEIAEALGVSWHAVHYAYTVLSKRESARAIVNSLDGTKPRMLDARAADLIARHIGAADMRNIERKAARARKKKARDRKKRRQRAK